MKTRRLVGFGLLVVMVLWTRLGWAERFCRKFAFSRPNVKVVCRTINDL